MEMACHGALPLLNREMGGGIIKISENSLGSVARLFSSVSLAARLFYFQMNNVST